METSLRTLAGALAMTLCSGVPAMAQSQARPNCRDAGFPSVASLVTSTPGNFKRMRSRETVAWLAFGAAGSAAARAADTNVSTLSTSHTLDETFEPGAIVGGTPFQLTASMVTYSIGRMTHSPCAATVGADLVRAQLLAEGLTMGLKHVFRRNRPEGSGYSFPSGHTTVSFASATVLQQHFGWKIGAPAYAAAAYVAASRVQMKRHYLSDVAFGAALGIVSGRTVAFGSRRQFALEPTITPGGAGALVKWTGQ
jgi:membrane-associated phospholipid phosphatase